MHLGKRTPLNEKYWRSWAGTPSPTIPQRRNLIPLSCLAGIGSPSIGDVVNRDQALGIVYL